MIMRVDMKMKMTLGFSCCVLRNYCDCPSFLLIEVVFVGSLQLFGVRISLGRGVNCSLLDCFQVGPCVVCSRPLVPFSVDPCPPSFSFFVSGFFQGLNPSARFFYLGLLSYLSAVSPYEVNFSASSFFFRSSMMYQ